MRNNWILAPVLLGGFAGANESLRRPDYYFVNDGGWLF